MKTSDKLKEAFAYTVNGYSVMPIRNNKKPFLASWKDCQTNRADEDQILSWWKKYPDANIGIITGKISGISVVDVDTYKDGDISKFPATYTVETGNGGYHLYYQYQEGLSISANAYPNMPGIDIRSDGGFIVAPPSITDYIDERTGEKKGGAYKIVKNLPLAPFPLHLFPQKKPRKTLTQMINIQSGSRNDSITSFIGKLLEASKESDWYSEVFPSVERVNKTYTPPLSAQELKTTFESIVKKELTRRQSLILSPIQMPNGEELSIKIRKNKQGIAYKDMANVLAVLEHHPFYKDTIRYNEFRQEIEYNSKPFEENDLIKIQYFMQTEAELHSITKDAVYSAISHYAYKNKYDEAQDWLTSLIWDQKPRLASWISEATGVEDDSYYQGIGAQWFTGMIRRIMQPGAIFDYVLVIVGGQGIGKTSLFRILGGPWYKSYTGAMDNKDFYLALRGAMIVDLDEGAAMYKSEAIKIKSIITETHDEYRAPYDRVMKKYPRRFVFSMSTNDTEPFRDVTGNRRYWTIDAPETIRFKWLEENRNQLFAEAYHYYKNGIEIPEVPLDKALQSQEDHLPDDSWTFLVEAYIKKFSDYCEGKVDFSTTIHEVYQNIFTDSNLSHLGRQQEMRIAHILKKEMGMEKRRMMVEGERKWRWLISPKKIKDLQEKNATQIKDEFDEL